MTNERLSVILEIFSFFLVTTDLYGEERLKELDNIAKNKLAKSWARLNSKNIFSLNGLKDEYEYIIDWLYETLGRWPLFIVIFLFIVYLSFFCRFEITIMEIMFGSYFGYAPNFFIELLMLVASFYTAVLLLLIFIKAIPLLPIFFTIIFNLPQRGLLIVTIYLLNKKNMKGAWIIIGGILFLISKVLIF